MLKALLTILLVGSLFTLNAQGVIKPKAIFGSISGNILDSKLGKPLAYANIHLQSINQTTVSFHVESDKNGGFEIQKLAPGWYQLSISLVGYGKATIDSIKLYDYKMDIVLEDINLNDSTSTLSQVIVYSEKPLIEYKDGKLIVNVAESPLSNGTSASEMLRNLPLMNVNPDGTLLMQGRVPLILMDEKPVNLNGQQLVDLLESLPANVVEKVEIMSNPPPEYATYPGGVINIITKKGRIGLYERIAINMGSKGEKSTSANFNYRSSKFNFLSSMGVGNNEVRGNSYSHRTNIYSDHTNYFYTNSVFKNRNTTPNMRLQADYNFNKKSSASIVYQGNLNYYNNHSDIISTYLDSNLNVYKANTRVNQYDGDGYSHTVSSTYQWKGKNPVEKLQVSSSLSFSKNDNNRDFYQQFLQSDFLPSGLDSTLVQLTDNYIRSFYLNSNYNKPFNDTGTIYMSFGASLSNVTHHNILSTSYLNKLSNNYISNDLLSNNFYFNQSVMQLRTSLIWGLPLKWRIIAGVQAENTVSDFQFIKGNSQDANNTYWNFLPTITLRKEFNKELNISWVYRETIRRPGITELNPNIDYSDPYNIRYGNPLIKPTLNDNYDFNVVYVKPKFNINSNLGYNHIKQVFNAVRTLIDNGKTQTTYQNISDQDEISGSIWTGITIAKAFKLNLSGGFIYYKYSDREKSLYHYIDGATQYATLNYSYAFNSLTMMEASNRYGSYINPQGRSRSNINMSISIMHKFLDKKLVVSVAAIDPFALQKFDGYTTGTNFSIISHSESNTQNFRLSLSYQLSKTKIKSNLDDKQKKEVLEKLNQK